MPFIETVVVLALIALYTSIGFLVGMMWEASWRRRVRFWLGL
jgi:hypothetical protein